MTTIDTRTMGRTGLALTTLGFGAASLGNLYKPVDDAAAHGAVAAALAAGIRYFDTAPHYGRGLSERRLGDALRGAGDVVVSTKVGRLMVPDDSVTDDRERDGFRSVMPFRAVYDYTHDGILRSHEASLHRLGLAKVDILFVHDIGGLTHGDAAAHYWAQLTDGGGFRALERLRHEGVIRGFGLGVNEVEVCLDAMRVAELDVILLAGRYSLLDQQALDAFFPACIAAGTAVVIGGPYNSGILATGVRSGRPLHYDYAAPSAEVVERTARIEAIADTHGIPLPAAALAFVLAHPAVATVIPGMGSPARVEATAALAAHPIPAGFWSDLRASGLVRAYAPLPGEPA